MKQLKIYARLDACIAACESLLKEMYAMKAVENHLDAETTENQRGLPVFAPRQYVPIAVWLETEEGKTVASDLSRLNTWYERALCLSNMVGWEVDDHQLRRAINRLNHSKRKKGQ